MTTADLGGRTWTDVAPGARPVLLVPLGSVEQHGPHLPLDTDTRIAVALAHGLAERRTDVVVAPAVAYGASGEHAGFPGTLSIGTEALTTVLIELGRSADAFAAIVLVNGHGGNAEAVLAAVSTLVEEGRTAAAWSPSIPDGDAHAGRTETSLLLAIDPDVVRLERAEPGEDAPLREIISRLMDGGVAAVSPNGVLGDPRGASADEGAALLGELVDQLDTTVSAVVPG
jgi:mycofactocin system creatininase family protein